MTDKNARRKLLKTLAASSGAIMAGKNLPDQWKRPVVDAIMLPAHAQTSCVIAGEYCQQDINNAFTGIEINVASDWSISITLYGLTNTYTGTGIADPNTGTFDILTDRASAQLSVTGTVICNSTAISGDIDDAGNIIPYSATQANCPLTFVSDRNIKTGFEQVDELDILDKVAQLPIETWSYTDREPGVRHIGPMAQDFMRAFQVGDSDRHIHMVDANGVNLAAIKALNRKLEEKDAQIAELQAKLDGIMHKLEEQG